MTGSISCLIRNIHRRKDDQLGSRVDFDSAISVLSVGI